MKYSLSEAKRLATQTFGSYENFDGLIAVRASSVRATFGAEKYERFLNWMTGQTCGVAENGETLYYFEDILRFMRGLPVID